eukprot:8718554-Prorocentrum_lima.AAC.1
MTSSLVGSEMCIRDREQPGSRHIDLDLGPDEDQTPQQRRQPQTTKGRACLLYTSDAADDM